MLELQMRDWMRKARVWTRDSMAAVDGMVGAESYQKMVEIVMLLSCMEYDNVEWYGI